MFFDEINDRRTVEGNRLASDQRGQRSHESRSWSMYSCASIPCQISLPKPRSSVMWYLGSAGGLVRARTSRARSSAGKRLAASISSSRLKIADISRPLGPESITDPCWGVPALEAKLSYNYRITGKI